MMLILVLMYICNSFYAKNNNFSSSDIVSQSSPSYMNSYTENNSNSVTTVTNSVNTEDDDYQNIFEIKFGNNKNTSYF